MGKSSCILTRGYGGGGVRSAVGLQWMRLCAIDSGSGPSAALANESNGESREKVVCVRGRVQSTRSVLDQIKECGGWQASRHCAVQRSERVYMQSGGGDVARYEHAGLAEVACQLWLAVVVVADNRKQRARGGATRRARALAPPSPCTRRSTP